MPSSARCASVQTIVLCIVSESEEEGKERRRESEEQQSAVGRPGGVVGGVRVDLGADLPDLPLVVRERADLAHGDEGRGEVGEELVVGGGVGLARDVGAGGRVEQQRGVGGEEAAAAGDEPVVAGVEGGGRVRVEVEEGGVVAGPALPAKARRVVAVQRRVGAAVRPAAEAVQPRRHRRAPRLADRVRA